MTVKVGEAYRYKGTGPVQNLGASHTCVVVAVTNLEVVLVPISSEQSNFDPACPVDVEDKWKPITRQSFAAYFDSKKTTIVGFEANTKSKHITPVDAPSKEVMERILSGICKSKNSEPWLRKIFDCPDTKKPAGRILDAG